MLEFGLSLGRFVPEPDKQSRRVHYNSTNWLLKQKLPDGRVVLESINKHINDKTVSSYEARYIKEGWI